MKDNILQEVIAEKTRRLKEIEDTLAFMYKSGLPRDVEPSLLKEQKEIEEELDILKNNNTYGKEN